MGLVDVATRQRLDNELAGIGTRILVRDRYVRHQLWLLLHRGSRGEERAYHEHAALCLDLYLGRTKRA